MSISATANGSPSRSDFSTAVATTSTSAPWLSVPVNVSRWVASTSAAVWRVIRDWAERKTKYSTRAAMSAADSVTSTMLPADLLELGEDRNRIAPDPDDAADLSVGDQREVFADDVGRAEGRPGSLAGGDVGDAGRRSVAGQGRDEIGAHRTRPATSQRVVGRDDPAIRAADLDPEDLAGRDERREPPLEGGLA